jgi:hypothetical protein
MSYNEIDEKIQKGELFSPDSLDALRKMTLDPLIKKYLKLVD